MYTHSRFLGTALLHHFAARHQTSLVPPALGGGGAAVAARCSVSEEAEGEDPSAEVDMDLLPYIGHGCASAVLCLGWPPPLDLYYDCRSVSASAASALLVNTAQADGRVKT
ncbi:hypothetical protein PLESTB_001264800 [Pleodorina starrii]|uniref:Uncharacterized protein n=1 Tax=Pleodorina starrii TaxID=330485 RepID=A0A9W6BSX5_9CHLO|nr:hypothetical protein PLESTM_000713700 [Pleodorina starrii]GLC57769.1 hypothetical protein PLESTB_001264800 [Pleodorina starrii]